MTTNPEHLPDDFAAAIKAADDYTDALDYLQGHRLTLPMRGWIRQRLEDLESDPVMLRNAARTFGSAS